MPQIHPTALVDSSAKIADDVKIGPFCIVGPEVTLGPGNVLDSNVQIINRVEVGSQNQFAHGCTIGNIGQDSNFNNPEAKIVIGNNNKFRENVTVHLPAKVGNITRIGDNNFLMVNVHIGHDVQIGSNVIMVPTSAIAGYVEIGNNAYISALVGIHQHVRVGEYALVGGVAALTLDLPPYFMAAGTPAKVHGINLVGMRRANFSPELIRAVKNAYKIMYLQKNSLQGAIAKIESDVVAGLAEGSAERQKMEEFVNFLKTSKRGIAPKSRSESEMG